MNFYFRNKVQNFTDEQLHPRGRGLDCPQTQVMLLIQEVPNPHWKRFLLSPQLCWEDRWTLCRGCEDGSHPTWSCSNTAPSACSGVQVPWEVHTHTSALRGDRDSLQSHGHRQLWAQPGNTAIPSCSPWECTGRVLVSHTAAPLVPPPKLTLVLPGAHFVPALAVRGTWGGAG